MSAAPSQAYLKSKVLTASPAELRLLLLDGAIRFAEQARSAYETRDFERSYEGTTKCQAILTELMCSLRPEREPELCSRLAALYTYMYRRLVEASSNKSYTEVEEVIRLLRYERETWTMAMTVAGKAANDTTSGVSGFDSQASNGTASRISLQG